MISSTMNFFLLTLDTQTITNRLLEEGCRENDVTYVPVDPSQQTELDLTPQKGDGLYRVSDASHVGMIEMEMALLSQNMVSFYTAPTFGLINQEEFDSIHLPKLGLPTPKTVSHIPKDRAALKHAVEELGGFPIIIKALGGSHGVGVMRVDSYASLFSVSDYLREQNTRMVLKEFINVRSSARLIVLGSEVIDSIEYRANEDDFRSNEGSSPNVAKATFSQSIQDTAVQAVHGLGLEFGGVDIMMSDDQAYIAEVNFPCFFGRCQMLTGTNISGMMIHYLKNKSYNL